MRLGVFVLVFFFVSVLWVVATNPFARVSISKNYGHVRLDDSLLSVSAWLPEKDFGENLNGPVAPRNTLPINYRKEVEDIENNEILSFIHDEQGSIGEIRFIEKNSKIESIHLSANDYKRDINIDAESLALGIIYPDLGPEEGHIKIEKISKNIMVLTVSISDHEMIGRYVFIRQDINLRDSVNSVYQDDVLNERLHFMPEYEYALGKETSAGFSF